MLLKRLPEATDSLQRAASLDQASPILQSNLGSVLAMSGRFEEAITALRRAVDLGPDTPETHHNLALALRQIGLVEEAEDQFRQAIRLRPDHRAAGSGLISTLQYRRHDRARVFAEHRDWEKRVAAEVPRWSSHLSDASTDRRLRVGYVSADFRLHSVAFFIEPLIAGHDRNAVEVFCYSVAHQPDAVSARIREQADVWRDVGQFDDRHLAQIIHDDRIDILVDLAGHTGGERLLAFAARPAPIQVTYLGYPDTTGLAAMDYRLTDPWADPPGEADRFHVEKLIRVNRSAWCYRPPDNAPAVGMSPCRESGAVTFGSFNNLPKLSMEILQIWARMLQRIGDSRLLLKTKALGDAGVRQRVLEPFIQRGIDPKRIELAGHTEGLADHLSAYGRIDIALDSFPYHGTTTTCDALWMGVPVITLAGDRHVSRVGVSLLNAVGHPEWIASSADEYLELAASLAGDHTRLQNSRQTLRQEMSISPLTDGQSLAREIEGAFGAIWADWCRKRKSV